MRKALLLAATAASMIVPAAAADEAGYRAGPYAGLAVGYSSGVLQAEDVDLASAGAFGGAYVGFGGFTGGLYLGVEGDGMLTGIKSKLSDADFSVTGKNSYLASVRARAGVPVGPALIYVTAGPAFTDTKLKATDGVDSLTQSETLIGLAAGGGIEAALTNTVLLRLEAIHYAFPAEKFGLADSKIDLEQRETVVRVGLGFRLN